MVFSSLTFLQCFLLLCLLAYFLVPQKWRNGTLFLFSLLFYAWGEPVYVVLMLFSTALDYTCGQMVERHRGQRGAKIALLVSVCVNLGLLGVFKYSDFLIGTVNSLFGTALPQPNLPLPILHRQDTRPMCTGSGHAISRNWFSESKNILRISQAFA